MHERVNDSSEAKGLDVIVRFLGGDRCRDDDSKMIAVGASQGWIEGEAFEVRTCDKKESGLEILRSV